MKSKDNKDSANGNNSTQLPNDNIENDIFGCMTGTVTIKGDTTKPIDVAWEANSHPTSKD